jgi:ADP-heptose:LPS heptosyltransferase
LPSAIPLNTKLVGMPKFQTEISSGREKLLVIKHGAFGDLIQTDGALRDIRAGYPEAEIVLLTTPPYRRLMERCPHLDRILLDARAPIWRIGQNIRLVRSLRGEHFARVFDLQKSGRTERYRALLFRGVPWCGRQAGPRPRSMIEGFAPQLEAAGVPARHSLRPDVSWMADDVSDLLAAAAVGADYIVLIPGCSVRHSYRRWPHYPALAQRLIELGHTVITAPGPDELELARSVPGTTLLGPDGCLDLFQLAGVLRRARFVIGNDTGPSHLAACLGRPGLGLYGPRSSSVRAGICRGRFEAIDAPDLDALSVDTVLKAVISRL